MQVLLDKIQNGLYCFLWENVLRFFPVIRIIRYEEGTHMIADNIRNYRKANNMSQDELAEKLGVSRQSISLWENGQTQPTLDNIVALAKIFNITSDALLCAQSAPEASAETAAEAEGEKAEEEPQGEGEKPDFGRRKKIFLLAGAGTLLLVLIVGAGVWIGLKNRPEPALPAEDTTVSSDGEQTSEPAETGSDADADSRTSDTAQQSKKDGEKTAGTAAKPKESTAATTAEAAPEPQPEAQPFDLFTYCKEFAIQKGRLNGDYCIYQQPATRYGGYADEYFSISYWGDSNMVEFCLHCPLSETLSINFYLRMWGGYNKKYEYLSSKYYRDNGESLRSATGTIDPAVFSDRYPLNCDEYIGSADGQTEFMEESRVGMCDLIHCLKNFVATENMECDFSAFDFVNY